MKRRDTAGVGGGQGTAIRYGALALLVLLLGLHHVAMNAAAIGDPVPVLVSGSAQHCGPRVIGQQDAACAGCMAPCPLMQARMPERQSAPTLGDSLYARLLLAQGKDQPDVAATLREHPSCPRSARARCAVLQVFRI